MRPGVWLLCLPKRLKDDVQLFVRVSCGGSFGISPWCWLVLLLARVVDVSKWSPSLCSVAGAAVEDCKGEEHWMAVVFRLCRDVSFVSAQNDWTTELSGLVSNHG